MYNYMILYYYNNTKLLLTIMTQKKYHQGNCTLEGHSFDEPPI